MADLLHYSLVPVEIDRGLDQAVRTQHGSRLAQKLQDFLNEFLSLEQSKKGKEKKVFDRKKQSGVRFEVTIDCDHGEDCLLISPGLGYTLNPAVIAATFYDSLHFNMRSGDGCPLDSWQCKVAWEPLNGCPMSQNTKCEKLELPLQDAELVDELRMLEVRQQHILSPENGFHTVARGPYHRILNLLSGRVMTYGGQMIQRWVKKCASCKSAFYMCSNHNRKLKQWINACPCYSDVWVDLLKQESMTYRCKAMGSKSSDLLRTLDKLVTIIDNRKQSEEIPPFLPAWTGRDQLSSSEASDVLLTAYEQQTKTEGICVVTTGPMGCGKSTAWIRFLQKLVMERLKKDESLRVMVVVPKISLSTAVAKLLDDNLLSLFMSLHKYNTPYYKPIVLGGIEDHVERDVYVTVVNSLQKVYNHDDVWRGKSMDIVILDEMESIFDNLCSNLMDREKAAETCDLMMEFVSRSKMTLCLDATMTCVTPQLLTRKLKSMMELRLCPRRREQQTLVLCNGSSPVFPIKEGETDSDDFFNIICAVAASPSSKIAVCFGCKKTAYSMRALLRENTDRSVLLVSGDEPDEMGDVCEQFARCSQYDITILTPAVSVGMSEATCTFTHVFAYVEISPHIMPLREYIQMLARMRHVRYPYTYVAFTRPRKGSPSDIPHIPRIPYHKDLKKVYEGKKELEEQWQSSVSQMTRDFITMWKSTYTSCQQGTKVEQEPLVQQYEKKMIEPVIVEPESIKRPTQDERNRCRVMLKAIQKEGSITEDDVDLLHTGGCLSEERASYFKPLIDTKYDLVPEKKCVVEEKRDHKEDYPEDQWTWMPADRSPLDPESESDGLNGDYPVSWRPLSPEADPNGLDEDKKAEDRYFFRPLSKKTRKKRKQTVQKEREPVKCDTCGFTLVCDRCPRPVPAQLQPPSNPSDPGERDPGGGEQDPPGIVHLLYM